MKCGININYCYLYRHVENNLPRSDNNFANNRNSSYNCSLLRRVVLAENSNFSYSWDTHGTPALKNISGEFHFGKGDGLARDASKNRPR